MITLLVKRQLALFELVRVERSKCCHCSRLSLYISNYHRRNLLRGGRCVNKVVIIFGVSNQTFHNGGIGQVTGNGDFLREYFIYFGIWSGEQHIKDLQIIYSKRIAMHIRKCRHNKGVFLPSSLFALILDAFSSRFQTFIPTNLSL